MTLIDNALAHLNIGSDSLFALTYNPKLNAWQVLRIAKLDTKGGGEAGQFYGTCYVAPHGTSHASANAALSDAIKLSLATA